MKKYIVIFVLVTVFAGSAFGIDRAKKNTSPKPDSAQTATPQNTPAESGSQNSSQGFDNFVDKNNNGIDDRAEKNKPSQTKKTKADTAQTKTENPD